MSWDRALTWLTMMSFLSLEGLMSRADFVCLHKSARFFLVASDDHSTNFFACVKK